MQHPCRATQKDPCPGGLQGASFSGLAGAFNAQGYSTDKEAAGNGAFPTIYSIHGRDRTRLEAVSLIDEELSFLLGILFSIGANNFLVFSTPPILGKPGDPDSSKTTKHLDLSSRLIRRPII